MPLRCPVDGVILAATISAPKIPAEVDAVLTLKSCQSTDVIMAANGNSFAENLSHHHTPHHWRVFHNGII